MDKGRLIALTAVLLGLLVFSVAWSAALYVMLGFSIESVRPWSVFEYIAAYGAFQLNDDFNYRLDVGHNFLTTEAHFCLQHHER